MQREWGGAGRGEWGLGWVLVAESVGRTLSPSARVVVLLKSDFLGLFLLAPVRGGLHFFSNAQRNEAKKRVLNRQFLSVVIIHFRFLART